MATALNIHRLPSRALIVGLGKTGLSCARYLSGLGMQVAVTDSREQPPGLEALRAELPDVGLFLGGFAPQAFAHAELLVVSPGVPLATSQVQAAMERGIPVIGDVELFAQAVTAPVAAITGSNGKSTVTTLLGLMAREAGLNAVMGGNLGEPVLDLLQHQAELYVLELSSFQLESTQMLSPAVATVLNISADHLDRYPSLSAYAQVKSSIYARAEVGVYNRDDPLVMAMPRTADALFFTLAEPRDEHAFGLRQLDGKVWLCRGSDPLIAADEMLMPGRHNLANALAALAMGVVLNLPLAAMLNVLRRFRGLPHRTEHVATIDQVIWYNDSKGTNPGATISALEGLDRGDQSRTVLIAGGECKQADFSELAAAAERYARALVLLGRDAHQIRAALGREIQAVDAATMAEAVRLAASLAQPGDRVLLSPACASFDMFQGFEQRGDAFKSCVKGLRS